MSSKELLKISLILTLVASAGSAFGATINGSTVIGSSSFSPSANVTIIAGADDAHYGAFAGHLSGNRVYFGNNSDPKLYFSTKEPGTVITNSPVTSAVAPDGWSTL